MKNWKNKIINVVMWLLRMREPKIHMYEFQKVFNKRDVPLSSIKEEFQQGLLKYIEHNGLYNLTMGENKEFQKVTFKAFIADGKK